MFMYFFFVFFFKQKTAYEMRISDWSSDVCSSDLRSSGNTMSGPPDRRNSCAACISRAVDPCYDLNAPWWLVAARPILIRELTPWPRSEERRVGKECVSTCRSRWSPYH